MDILKTVLTIIFVIDCIALACIILLQEGKSAGLGTISGAADTYWGHNKGRSMDYAIILMIFNFIKSISEFLASILIIICAVKYLKKH